tara:strand:+ start:730 stop:900 length:171 start_codon:yes stop_codon:yes gene_type:complete
LISSIIEYENGNLTNEQTIEFFQELVDSGLVWDLQGAYGRMAEYLISIGEVQVKVA